MKISIIAAVSRNGVIGKNGQLPWHLPNDLKRFRELTMGKPVIMGRKTVESLPKKYVGQLVKRQRNSSKLPFVANFQPSPPPLPGRTVIVMSNQYDYYQHGCITANSVKHALDIAETCGRYDGEVMIAGGEAIYKAFLPLATHLYLTIVETVCWGREGELSFLGLELDNLPQWKGVDTEYYPPDEKHSFHYFFQELWRRRRG